MPRQYCVIKKLSNVSYLVRVAGFVYEKVALTQDVLLRAILSVLLNAVLLLLRLLFGHQARGHLPALLDASDTAVANAAFDEAAVVDAVHDEVAAVDAFLDKAAPDDAVAGAVIGEVVVANAVVGVLLDDAAVDDAAVDDAVVDDAVVDYVKGHSSTTSRTHSVSCISEQVDR